MANKNMRTVKIYGMSGYKYQATPTIMLKGKWLEELGFEIGDYITVSCEDGRLIITPDAERAALAKAEQEFMEREIAKYAAEHPFCELCFERGIIVPTEEIHHKLPLSEGGTHDRSNLIALCKSCHSTIHAKRGDYWGNHRG